MISGKLTISRPTFGDGKEKIVISVKDQEARARFLEVEVDYADFAKALTGYSEVPIEFEAIGLERVGKVQEMGSIEFLMPKDESHSKAIATAIALDVCPEGWTVDTYFGSKSSFFIKDGKYYARATIKRWVEKTISPVKPGILS